MTIPSVGGADQPYCSFYVGQKVVCIDDNWRFPPRAPVNPDNLPVLDRVYTVAKVTKQMFTGHPCINLGELPLPGTWYYASKNFRPVTDISVFEALLDRAPIDDERRLRELEREGA